MPVSMSFPLPFSMYAAIEDALRLSWAVRKKPLESFLLVSNVSAYGTD